MNRVLVVRGGAIGDFVLTLPALKALRDAWPQAQIEILGYKHIIALAENRFYADAVRSIEYAGLSSFFASGSELPAELTEYFANFDLVISYLFDPDKIFASNLERCGIKRLIKGPSKIDHTEHAARQLGRPVEELGIKVTDLAARIFPSAEDRQFASEFLKDLKKPFIAIHPGSGSERKNWPLEKWIALGTELLGQDKSLLVIGGESDGPQLTQLKRAWTKHRAENLIALSSQVRGRVMFAQNLPLPRLAAVLDQTVFVGHDSGISHLAAAAGANCILLFGPTDPAIWAPLNKNARILRAPENDLRLLNPELVREALNQALMRIGIST